MMTFFKHSLSIALLASASLLTGCAAPVQTASPSPAAPNYPDSIKTYVGSVKLLVHQGDVDLGVEDAEARLLLAARRRAHRS